MLPISVVGQCFYREWVCHPVVAARALATYLIPGCVGRGVRLGTENSSGAAGAGVGVVWKSGNVCWHQNWSEMGPYGSIWLDTAAKMIVWTLRIFFVFQNSLKIGLGVPKEAHDSKNVLPRGPKKRSMTQHVSLKNRKFSKNQDPSIQDELILS